MSRKRRRFRQAPQRSSRVAYGVGAALLLGGAGVALYFLLKKRDLTSEPSDWSLPLFGPAYGPAYGPEYRPEMLQACSCPPGSSPIRRADGSCYCSEVVVEVVGIGSKCRATSECAPGDICINGECRPAAEWEA